MNYYCCLIILNKNIHINNPLTDKYATGKSGDGAGDCPNVSWKYFERLSFLDKVVIAVPTFNSMQFVISDRYKHKKVLQSSGFQEEQSCSDMLDEVGLASDDESIGYIHSEISKHQSNEDLEKPEEPKHSWSPSKARKRKKALKDQPSSSSQLRDDSYIKAIDAISKECCAKSDEDELLGMYIASQLRKMSPKLRSIAHIKLLSLLGEIKLEADYE